MSAGSSSEAAITLTVAGEATNKTGADAVTVDIIDRDPTDMNSHLKVTFEEIFAEPHETIFAFDSVWLTSFTVFRNTKLWCYRITTLLCAVPAAFFWGINFALLSCCSIWCCRPAVRCFQIEMHCCKGFYTAIIDSFVKPCYVAAGFVFHNFRIFLHQGGGDDVEDVSMRRN